MGDRNVIGEHSSGGVIGPGPSETIVTYANYDITVDHL